MSHLTGQKNSKPVYVDNQEKTFSKEVCFPFHYRIFKENVVVFETFAYQHQIAREIALIFVLNMLELFF